MSIHTFIVQFIYLLKPTQNLMSIIFREIIAIEIAIIIIIINNLCMSVHVLDGLDLTSFFFFFEARFRPYLRVLMYARSTVIYADPMKPKLSINFAGDLKKKKERKKTVRIFVHSFFGCEKNKWKWRWRWRWRWK